MGSMTLANRFWMILYPKNSRAPKFTQNLHRWFEKTEVQTHSKQGFPVIPKDGAKLPRAANAGHFGHSNKQNNRAPWISKNQTFTHLASGKVILLQHNNWQAQHKNLSPKNCFNYEKLTCNLQDLSLGTRNTCPPKKMKNFFGNCDISVSMQVIACHLPFCPEKFAPSTLLIWISPACQKWSDFI